MELTATLAPSPVPSDPWATACELACVSSAWSPFPAVCLFLELVTYSLGVLHMDRPGARCKGDTVTCMLAARELVCRGLRVSLVPSQDRVWCWTG